MKVTAKLTGTDTVLKNLNREIKEIRGRTRGGMRQAALVVRRRAQQLTPVDTGNLWNSAFTEVTGGGGTGAAPPFVGPEARRLSADYSAVRAEAKAKIEGAGKDEPTAAIGFSAYYAAKVHETNRSYRRPGSQWKFLETAIKENHKRIIQIIKDKAKV